MATNAGPGLLPSLMEQDDYHPLFANNDVWLPAIRAICRRHGIATDELKRTVLGTHIVFQAGDYIVKLFCRFWPHDYTVEAACLSKLTELPIPQLVATGELEGWPYIIMTVLKGTPTGKIWRSIDVEQKTSIMRDLGRFIRRLHDRPHIAELPSDWDTFLCERVNGLRKHHHLTEEQVAWVRDFIEPIATSRKPLVVLNCDLTHDHVLVEHTGRTWSFSGIIDFGDAMIGHPYYDFTAPLVDHAFGEPTVAEALLQGYGERFSDKLIQELSRFLFTHRFWALADMSGNAAANTPEEFLNKLWGRNYA